MKRMLMLSGMLALVLAGGCDRAAEPPVLMVYHDGKEFYILDRGDTVDVGYPAYFVRYYSRDIGDPNVLETERADLYSIIARHVETDKHRRVVIESVEPKGRLFGLLPPREISHSLSVKELLKTHPDSGAPAAKE